MNRHLPARLREAVCAYTAAEGHSRAELCEAVGCSTRTLLSWMRGDTEPCAGDITRLSEAFDRSPNWLLGFQADLRDG